MAFGFRAVRHQTGGKTFRQKLYPAITSGAVYIGDPVGVSSGVVKPLDNMSAGVSAACLGVVAAVYDSNRKPLTHSLPTDAPYKKATVSGYFLGVYDDPDIVYEVEADATASATQIGVIKAYKAGTPTTAAGISGFQLELGNVSASADGCFRVIGVSQTGNLALDNKSTKVEVVINKHTFGA